MASSERNYLNLALKQKNHSELDQIELGLIKMMIQILVMMFLETGLFFPLRIIMGKLLVLVEEFTVIIIKQNI